MGYYIEPNSTDTQGIFEFFRYVNNTASEGLFFPVILFAIWIITFLGTKQYSTSRAWVAASILTAFLSIPLAIAELIAPKWMYLLFTLVAIGILWLKLDK